MSVRAALRPRGAGEWALLAALAVWSAVSLAILLARDPGGQFTGVDARQIGDGLQYLAWVRDSGDHLLISNRFDSVEDPHLFPHPMWLVSGGLWRAGLGLQLAYLLWKPVAVLVLFASFALYVRRMLDGAAARAAALALALFFFAPAAWITDWTGAGSADLEFGSLTLALEMFPAGFTWGVLPTAITLGLMPPFLLGVERLLEEGPDGRLAAATGAAGLAASWLHPWQGLTLLAILAGLVVWDRFDRRHLRLAVPVIATCAPLALYAAQSTTDSAWHAVSRPNDMPHLGWWLVACFVPFAAVAVLGVDRGRAREVGERALLLWVPAALAVCLALQSSFFYHAFAGLSLPLAVLSVRAARRFRLPRAAGAAAVALATLPGLAWFASELHDAARNHYLVPGEDAAFAHLRESGRPGPVLTSMEAGRALPALADRNTWVGHTTWTPASGGRAERARALLDGELSPAAARALVRESGAAFVLADCRGRADLTEALGDHLASVRRFGCAAVYEIRPPLR